MSEDSIFCWRDPHASKNEKKNWKNHDWTVFWYCVAVSHWHDSNSNSNDVVPWDGSCNLIKMPSLECKVVLPCFYRKMAAYVNWDTEDW